MKKNLVPHGKCMLLGRWVGQIRMLPGAWLVGEGSRPVRFRRWVIVAIVLVVTVQHLLWESLYEMSYAIYLSGLAFVLNPVFMYCMIENFSSTAPRSVRDWLRVGGWAFYPLWLLVFVVGLVEEESIMEEDHASFLGITMHIIFDSIDGTFDAMGSPVSLYYIASTALGSIGALVGVLLCYLSAKLADGVRKIRKWQPGS